MRALLLAVLMLGTAACREAPAPGDAPAAIDEANPLEVAARDANLVEDPATTAPTGLFERRHSSGVDAMCFVPVSGDRYRFGLSASFGTSLRCEGSGTATHDGDQLVLRFSDGDSACVARATYDGMTVRIAGAVPAACQRLCDERAQMSGIAVGRVGWSASDAVVMGSRAHGGAPASRRNLCSQP